MALRGTRSKAASATSFGLSKHTRSFSTANPWTRAALQIHDQGNFFLAADGDPKLRVFQLSKHLREGIDAHAEAAFLVIRSAVRAG